MHKVKAPPQVPKLTLAQETCALFAKIHPKEMSIVVTPPSVATATLQPQPSPTAPPPPAPPPPTAKSSPARPNSPRIKPPFSEYRKTLVARALDEKSSQSWEVYIQTQSSSEDSDEYEPGDSDYGGYDSDKPCAKRELAKLSSVFDKEDLMPKFKKRAHTAGVSPQAKEALKDLRAKRKRYQCKLLQQSPTPPSSPSPPPSPYQGILAEI